MPDMIHINITGEPQCKEKQLSLVWESNEEREFAIISYFLNYDEQFFWKLWRFQMQTINYMV